MALLFTSLEDAAEFFAECEGPFCPHCDAFLHGPTDHCWCLGCPACFRARFFAAHPDGERALSETEAFELFEVTFGHRRPFARCGTCFGEGVFIDNGYVATEGFTRGGQSGTCPECDGSGEVRIDVAIAPVR